MKKVDKFKIGLGLALASLILYGVFKIFMFLKGDDDKSSGDSNVGTSGSINVTPPVSSSGGTEQGESVRTEESVSEASNSDPVTCSSVSECPAGYIKKTDSDSIQCSSATCDASLGGADLNTCCDPWTCAISVSDRALYNIQVGSNSISGNTISYTDIGGATVSCKAGAQRTGGGTEPSIGRCVNNNGNAILSGCEPESAAVNCDGNWSEWADCTAECGGGTQTRTYSITREAQNEGTPCPTTNGSQDSRPCNTEACATCSTVSGDCPDGYLYKTDSADIACNGPTCDVGTGGVDLNTCCLKFNCTDPFTQGNPPVGYVADENVGLVTFSGGIVVGVRCDTENGYYLPYFNIITATCGDDIDRQPPNYILSGCEQGCTSPGSLPTGYTGNLPAIVPVGVGDITGVQCAVNYNGTPTYNCTTAGEEYTIAGGCEPDMCTTPPDRTGYNITNVTSLQRNNFPVNVTCEDGYGPSNQGDIPRASCSGDSVDYTLTGCENKIGFCSGNTDPSNNVTCENGYKDKSDKNTIVGNTLETCCDQIITPEAQPSGTESTDLPFCSEVVDVDKTPRRPGNLNNDKTPEECIHLCFTEGNNCNSFSYNKDRRRCYFYENNHITDLIDNTNYDYYPVKCQP